MDPELDIYSPSFDAIKALRSTSFKPPKDVAPLDYVAKCRFLLPTWDPDHLKPNAPKQKPKEGAVYSNLTSFAANVFPQLVRKSHYLYFQAR